MLKTIDTDIITIHGRMALGLLAAEYAVQLLDSRLVTRTMIEDALSADWLWVETRKSDLGKLYWNYMPQLMEEDSRLTNDYTNTHEAALSVLHCALYAHSYFIWSAEGVVRLEEPGTVLGIGNDICDVDESYLIQCMELAITISPKPEETTHWLNNLITRMEQEQRKTVTDVIGSRLYRKNFSVPCMEFE